jgi:hypothetical protein
MFQGRNISLRRVANNQYEYKTPFTFAKKTAAEIEAMIDEQQQEARRSIVELSVAKAKLRQLSEANDVQVVLKTEPKIIPALPPAECAAPPPPAPPAPVARTPIVPPRPSTRPVASASARPRTRKHQVVVVTTDDKPKRRPSGMAYLAFLEQQRAVAT